MAKIENPKAYTGRDLETIFFRPMLCGPTAAELGIKIMYNMPVPTTLQFWKRAGDVLQKYTTAGWNGGQSATKFQKSIELSKVKAEIGYSAEDYFNMVFELITNRSDVNMDDLSGTELEDAETAIFKEAINESIRATMWLGDKTRNGTLSTFNGFIKRMVADMGSGENDIKTIISKEDFNTTDKTDAAQTLFKNVWNNASELLKEFKSQGNLVYLVTSDVYAKYEEELDNVILESAYMAKQNGRETLTYRGIPVVDVQISAYLKEKTDMPQSFAILTDRRNLALAVNTADFPGTEVRMWYNPDQMENRQRAVFMAGCDYLLPELVSMAAAGINPKLTSTPITTTGGTVTIDILGHSIVETVTAQGLNANDANDGQAVTLTQEGKTFAGTIAGSAIKKIKVTVKCKNQEALQFTI